MLISRFRAESYLLGPGVAATLAAGIARWLGMASTGAVVTIFQVPASTAPEPVHTFTAGRPG